MTSTALVVASVLSVLLVGRLTLHGAAPPAVELPASPVAPATIV
jgi:hypothetical protein